MSSSSSPQRATMANPPSQNFYPKNASLHGTEFAASCPPDVSPKTRIVAVCGITNIGDIASPTNDGWFLSDFWMFNHLFRNAPVANQIWLTCCSPKLLVDQYGRYSHGNPSYERRVVLEERLLDTIRAAGTLRVVEPKILLERFLKSVEDECKTAVKTGQDVLLLVFGHGDAGSYGVTIGSSSNTEFKVTLAPRLQINRLKTAVGKRTKCTLLITSCYSGGWAMRPDINLTIIAAAGPMAQSQSWNTSSSRGFSGSIFASAIRDAILASEIKDGEDVEKPGMAYDELQETETYAEMGCLIYDHLKQSDRFHSQHEISFAAQDDEWTKAWRKRTGIPLAFFKERWEELSVLPAQADGFSNRDPSSVFSDLSLSECRLGSTAPPTLSMTMPQMYNIVRSLAAGYAKSFPGANNLAINTTFHTTVRLLLSGERRYENRMDALLTLGDTLSYRLAGMTMATNYKDLLGLDYLDCAFCSIERWSYPLYESSQMEAKEKLLAYSRIKGLIYDAKIFSATSADQGYDYNKPGEYLAIAFIENKKTMDEVEQAISLLKDVQKATLAPKVEAVRRGRWFLDKADKILKPVKKTLRSISPHKRNSIISSE